MCITRTGRKLLALSAAVALFALLAGCSDTHPSIPNTSAERSGFAGATHLSQIPPKDRAMAERLYEQYNHGQHIPQ